MARTGWSTSNFLRCTSAVVTAVPLSFSVRARLSSLASQQVLMSLVESGGLSAFHLFFTLSNFAATTGDSAGSAASAVSTLSPTTGVWYNVVGTWAATNDRACYVDGANKGTDTTDLTPTGLNRTGIGILDRTSPSAPFAGDLAEAALWNVALSDADAAMLGLGVHPFLVRPDKLVAYWPVIGTRSPENNLKSNTATMAIIGSLSQSAHPRIFMPAKSLVNSRTAAPPALAGQILM